MADSKKAPDGPKRGQSSVLFTVPGHENEEPIAPEPAPLERLQSPSPPPRHNQRLSNAFRTQNETTPLLKTDLERGIPVPESAVEDPKDGEDEDDPHRARSVWYMIMLTLSIGGLQLAWAVELSNGSPYLLSLGLSKSLLALVWIAGPLSGAIVQPYVGRLSDNCRLKWGRRKPFMVGGAIALVASLLALAWTKEIVHGIAKAFGADLKSDGVFVSTIVFAVVLVYVLDCAINAVQAAIRAFIVDGSPPHQQDQAQAWASRQTGAFGIIAYLAADADLPRLFPWLGYTQFQILCALSCIVFSLVLIISIFYIKERDPNLDGPPENDGKGLFIFFRELTSSIKRLPDEISKVCLVQIFNWIGWFPFLFYITTYIGQLYVNPIFERNPFLSKFEIDAAWDEGTRMGSFALFVYSLTSFGSNILLPFIVAPMQQDAPELAKPHRSSRPSSLRASSSYRRPRTPATPGASGIVTYFQPSKREHTSRFSRFLSLLQIRWLSLRRAWFLGHVLFACLMASTFFVKTPLQGIIVVAIAGLPWSLTIWAPFALISSEISRRNAARRAQSSHRYRPSIEAGMPDSEIAQRDTDEDTAEKNAEDHAGVILGLHNVSVSAPQVLATLASSLIFKITQKPRGEPGDESLAWVLRFGGLMAIGAAVMTLRLKEDSGRDKGKGNGDTRGGVV